MHPLLAELKATATAVARTAAGTSSVPVTAPASGVLGDYTLRLPEAPDVSDIVVTIGLRLPPPAP